MPETSYLASPEAEGEQGDGTVDCLPASFLAPSSEETAMVRPVQEEPRKAIYYSRDGVGS